MAVAVADEAVAVDVAWRLAVVVAWRTAAESAGAVLAVAVLEGVAVRVAVVAVQGVQDRHRHVA